MILIPLKNCKECNECSQEKVYTPDSFEDVCKWICKKTKHKKNEITGYHELNDPDPSIPEWCPKRKLIKIESLIKILIDFEFDEMPAEDDRDGFKEFLLKYSLYDEDKLKKKLKEYA